MAGAAPAAAYFSVFTAGCIQRGDHGLDGRLEIFTTIAAAFITANIPTIVLLAIYFACREKRKRRRELEKMKLQDLN